MSGIRPGGNLGTVMQSIAQADSTATNVYATVMSVGSWNVDFIFDNGGGLMQKKPYTGNPRVGERVRIQIIDGEYTAICPVRR